MTDSANTWAAAEQELDRLCREAAADRELIAEGRLEELAESIATRERAFERLRRSLPEGALSGGRCAELVQRLHDEGASTMALLTSVREELASMVGQGRDVQQAVGRYESSGRL